MLPWQTNITLPFFFPFVQLQSNITIVLHTSRSLLPRCSNFWFFLLYQTSFADFIKHIILFIIQILDLPIHLTIIALSRFFLHGSKKGSALSYAAFFHSFKISVLEVSTSFCTEILCRILPPYAHLRSSLVVLHILQSPHRDSPESILCRERMMHLLLLAIHDNEFQIHLHK